MKKRKSQELGGLGPWERRDRKNWGKERGEKGTRKEGERAKHRRREKGHRRTHRFDWERRPGRKRKQPGKARGERDMEPGVRESLMLICLIYIVLIKLVVLITISNP